MAERRRGLGRGLGALIPSGEPEVKATPPAAEHSEVESVPAPPKKSAQSSAKTAQRTRRASTKGESANKKSTATTDEPKNDELGGDAASPAQQGARSDSAGKGSATPTRKPRSSKSANIREDEAASIDSAAAKRGSGARKKDGKEAAQKSRSADVSRETSGTTKTSSSRGGKPTRSRRDMGQALRSTTNVRRPVDMFFLPSGGEEGLEAGDSRRNDEWAAENTASSTPDMTGEERASSASVPGGQGHQGQHDASVENRPTDVSRETSKDAATGGDDHTDAPTAHEATTSPQPPSASDPHAETAVTKRSYGADGTQADADTGSPTGETGPAETVVAEGGSTHSDPNTKAATDPGVPDTSADASGAMATPTTAGTPTAADSDTSSAAPTEAGAPLVADSSASDTASTTIDTEAPVEGTSAEDLQSVPGATFAEILVSNIHPNRKQPRQVFDQDELAELAFSVKELGVLQPIVVRPSHEGGEQKYELVMGERRWRAVQEAGLSTIPAIIRDTADDDLLRDALLENLHRAQLNPLEEAAAYQQLMEEFGATQEQLSERIGRSRPQISNTLRLLRLPALVQRRVAAGVLSSGHARALLALTDPAEMERVAQRIVAEGLSVRATEELVALSDGLKRHATKRKAPTTRHDDRLGYIADAFSDKLDTSVKIQLGARKGKMTIEFASVEDLNRIIDVLDPKLDSN